jgi:hypothetical protein
MQAQGPGKDQVGLGRGPHTHTASAQIKAMATIQGGQGSRQAGLLTHSQAFHRQHLDLPTLLSLGAQGPEKPMCNIVEHAWGWCNKLEMGLQILKLFQGFDLVLLIETWHFPGQHLSHVEGCDSLALACIV